MSASLSSFFSSAEEFMPQARKGCRGRGWKEERGGRWEGEWESPASFIAQTTGVSLILCYVLSDEEMRGSSFPFFSFLLFLLLFIFPPGLRHALKVSLHFRQSQFHLHFVTYGAALPPACLLLHVQRPLSHYILHSLLQDSSKIKAAVKEGCRGRWNSWWGIYSADTRQGRWKWVCFTIFI